MNYEQFKYYLDAYGASLRRWPANTRTAAQALLLTDHAAAQALAEVARVDGVLDHYAPVADAAAAARLVARIAARAAAVPVRQGGFGFELGFGRGLGTLWPRAAALAFVTALGIMTGMFQTDFVGIGDRQTNTTSGIQLHSDDEPLDVAGL